MISHSSSHDRRIHAIAEDFRTRGFHVAVPSGDDPVLKEVLGDYQPDLLAIRGEEHVAIEIKTHAEKLPVARYQNIARRVGRHPGWRLLLYSHDPDCLEEITAGYDFLPSEDETRERLRRAQRMLEAGEVEAGFLLGWSALEGSVRKRIRDRSEPFETLGLAALLKHLYSEGELTHEQLEWLLETQSLRDRVVHGFKSEDMETLYAKGLNLVSFVSGRFVH
jgi:hypothetical protein